MSPDTARLLGIVGQLLLGMALLAVVWLLGMGDPQVPARRPATLRTGWFVVFVFGLAVVILAAVRLATVA